MGIGVAARACLYHVYMCMRPAFSVLLVGELQAIANGFSRGLVCFFFTECYLKKKK